MARILLVEDEDVQRRELEAILKSAGHEVFLAGNGAQALVLARDKKPDILLSDIAMPKMDGPDLCRHVRSDPKIADTWIVLITALEGGDAMEAATGAGTDDFVRKPVKREDILNRLALGVRARAARLEAAELREQLEAFQATQDALVAALDAGVRGIEEAAARMGEGEAAESLRILQETHAAVGRLLEGVRLVEGG